MSNERMIDPPANRSAWDAPPYYWKWLANAPKAHVFDSIYGRSLCGRWLHLGQPGGDSQAMGDEPGRDDCKTCWRKLKELIG